MRERGRLNLDEAFVAATFASAENGLAVGPTKWGRGAKIVAVASGDGLPFAVSVQSASAAECKPVDGVLGGSFLDELEALLVGDEAYDSDALDAQLATEYGIELIDAKSAALTVNAGYDRTRFSKAEVERLLEELELVLGRLAAEPDAPLSRLMRLSEQEQEALAALTGPCRNWEPTGVMELFARQVRQSPGSPACRDGEQALSYEELDRRSGLVARALRSLGVGQGTVPEAVPEAAGRTGERVALYLPRGVDHLTALLGVWKAGGVYVPLEPSYPAEYAARIAAEVEPRVIVTAALTGPEFSVGDAALLVFRQVLEPGQDKASDTDAYPAWKSEADDVAYIAYTSGSTGEPKGVMIEHRQLMNCLQALWEAQPFAPDEVVAQRTGAGFVVSIKEMLAGLLRGVPTFLADEMLVRDTPRFARALGEHKVTRLNLVPSQLGPLLDHATLLGSLRRVVVAGEPLLTSLAMRFRRLLPGAELYSNWGTSETNDLTYRHAAGPGSADEYGDTIDSAAGAIAPMGRPIANLRLHLLDERLRPVTVGASGELYAEGAAVGRGYWRRPELTRERFLPNHFAGNVAIERGSASGSGFLFRTGDLARLGSDGELHYLGRRDFQIKIRGQKVDPLTVEQVLALHPGVEQVAVLGWDGGTEQALLAAYWVPRETQSTAGAAASLSEPVPGASEVDGNRLHGWLAGRLPLFMIPAAWVRMSALPTLSNGKLDRGALPRPQVSAPSNTAEPPEGLSERILARVWTRILKLPLEQIHRDDNFFAIGGNSLLATQTVQLLREESNIDLDIKIVFENPVLRDLATHLAESTADGHSAHSFAGILPLRAAGTKPPLFCIHPIIGLGWRYATLLASIDRDRPIYALQARGFEGESLPSSMEELLSDYVARIRSIQPEGPYHLCGWSFGGLVAHLLAALLQAQRQSVAFLALLDAYPPHLRLAADPKPISNPRRFLGIWTSQTLLSLGFDQHAISQELTERIVGIIVNSASLIDKHYTDPAVPPRFTGNLLLFRALVDSLEFLNAMPAEVWSPYVSGDIRSFDIETSHIAMLEGVHGLEIGSLLEAALSRSDASPDFLPE